MIRILRENYTPGQALKLQTNQISISINAIVNYAKNHGQGDIAEAIVGIRSTLNEEIEKVASGDVEGGSMEFSIHTGLSDRDVAYLMSNEGIVVSDIVRVRGELEKSCKPLLDSLGVSIEPSEVTEDEDTDLVNGQETNTQAPQVTLSVPQIKPIKLDLVGSGDEVRQKIVEKLVQGSDVISGLAVGPFERLVAFIISGTVGNGRGADKPDVMAKVGSCEVKYLARPSSQCHSGFAHGSTIDYPMVVFVGADRFNPWFFVIPPKANLEEYFERVDFTKNKQRNNMRLKQPVREIIAKAIKQPVSEAYEIVE